MLNYIEKKEIAWEEIRQILQASADSNKWTNFGPVAEALQTEIEKKLQLPDNISVVACSSGTSALHALVNMHNFFNGKPLRWVISSFGFCCTQQGPLNEAYVIDCDKEGMLNLDLLDGLNFDGIVVTNVFGSNNLKKYKDYCEQNSKVFIGDSALAFDDHTHYANEIISLHQTKPWGMGEGGLAIIEKEHIERFKYLINFGLLADGSHPWGNNYKISDFAAAFALQRLRTIPSQEYRKQFTRIANIGETMGYRVLGKRNRTDTPASVPLLAPSPVWDLENPYVKLQKYYRPLDKSPIANDLYARMVNFPCHPEVESLPAKDITDVLTTLLID